ncbi:MAG: ion transporter [Bdellovibrionales bacterium]|nr:ion transporter [Bdellovibrionales bacterium]
MPTEKPPAPAAPPPGRESGAGPSEGHRLATVERKAARLGMTKRRYVLHRAEQNLERFINGSGFNFCIALLILVSVVLIFIEFLLPPGAKLEQVIALNDTLTWIFIVELSLRYLVAPSKRVYFENYWIDIIAVLPVLRVFRTLRLVRLLRILRLGRAMMILLRQSGWLSARLERSFGSFGFLALTAVMLIICGTLAMVSVEEHAPTGPEAVQQFLEKVWLTTFLFVSGEVIGDLPLTMSGKVIAVLISISGLIVFAVLVGTVSAWMTTYFRTKMDIKDLAIEDLREHIIICGWDRMGGLILSELESLPDIWMRGVVVVAETDEDIIIAGKIKNPRRLFHIREDFTKMDVLERVGAKRARSAIVLADKGKNLGDQDRDARTVLAALTLEKLNPKIFTCAELLDEVNATHLKIAGVEEIISRTSLTAGLFASTVVNRGISSVISDILTHHEGAYLRRFALPSEFIQQPFIEVFDYFKRRFDATILAVDMLGESGKFERHLNPAHDRLMEEHDMLVVVARVDSEFKDLT